MTILMSRLVFAPSVAVVGATRMFLDGVDDAVFMAGAEDAAEQVGTPLNELITRLARDPQNEGNGDDIAEFAGRQCYRSWTNGRAPAEYIDNVISEGHGSIFQHSNIVMQITGISRALSHELVRHGTGTGFSQESQRYVDAKDIRFVVPPITVEHLEGMSDIEALVDEEFTIFRRGCQNSLESYTAYQAKISDRLAEMKADGNYKDLTAYKKRANEAARALLPNACETRMVFSANLRSMRHILSLRGTEYADLEIRRLMIPILGAVRQYAPEFFRTVVQDVGADGRAAITALCGKV